MQKKSGKLMKIVNIDRENLYIVWTTGGISMKFSGKIWRNNTIKTENVVINNTIIMILWYSMNKVTIR